MRPLNRYHRRPKISERKFRQFVGHFALYFTASGVAELTGLTRKSVTTIFLKLRRRIALLVVRGRGRYVSCLIEYLP